MADKIIISKFKEKPKTKTAWWAMGLGLAAIFSGQFLGIFAAIIRPIIDRYSGENVGAAVGFAVGIGILVLVVIALIMSMRAFQKGERSWVVWVGLVPSSIAMAFWLLMFVGELLFSH